MKKIIFLIIAFVLIAVALVSYKIISSKMQVNEAANNNKIYESFKDVNVLGTDVVSLINKIEDQNIKNKINKNKDGFYIENDTNSVKLDINFLELDKKINFEAIIREGTGAFVRNFGAMEFKCTNIEYHSKTGNVKYLHFEQTK